MTTQVLKVAQLSNWFHQEAFMNSSWQSRSGRPWNPRWGFVKKSSWPFHDEVGNISPWALCEVSSRRSHESVMKKKVREDFRTLRLVLSSRRRNPVIKKIPEPDKCQRVSNETLAFRHDDAQVTSWQWLQNYFVMKPSWRHLAICTKFEGFLVSFGLPYK